MVLESNVTPRNSILVVGVPICLVLFPPWEFLGAWFSVGKLLVLCVLLLHLILSFVQCKVLSSSPLAVPCHSPWIVWWLSLVELKFLDLVQSICPLLLLLISSSIWLVILISFNSCCNFRLAFFVSWVAVTVLFHIQTWFSVEWSHVGQYVSALWVHLYSLCWYLLHVCADLCAPLCDLLFSMFAMFPLTGHHMCLCIPHSLTWSPLSSNVHAMDWLFSCLDLGSHDLCVIPLGKWTLMMIQVF